MATNTDKNQGNVPGPFYVDSSCIDCDMCRETSPEVFQRNEEVGLTVVYRQPTTPSQLATAIEAMNGCPTDSIGNDG